MTYLGDRLDQLARQASNVEWLPAELMPTARRRQRTRLQIAGTAAVIVMAVGTLIGIKTTSSPHPTLVGVGSPSPRSGETDHLAALPDTRLTPAGWYPIAVGTVQISVPASWFVNSAACTADGVVFTDGEPIGGTGSPVCTPRNVVSIGPSTSADLPGGYRAVLNSIDVTISQAQTTGPATQLSGPESETVRALGYDITAQGPDFKLVLATLTHSPLSVVLDSQVSHPPTDWKSIQFGGLQFSVPPTWTTDRYTWWGGCPGNLQANTLQLSTAQTFSALGCPPPPQSVQYESGVAALVVGSGPQIQSVESGATCVERNALRICIDPFPTPSDGGAPGHGVSILTAQISVPGQTTLDQIEIGLNGDGTSALNISDSLRPVSP